VQAGSHTAARSDSSGHVAIRVRFRHAQVATVTASKAGCTTGSSTIKVLPAH
jgi:hypothetical protein